MDWFLYDRDLWHERVNLLYRGIEVVNFRGDRKLIRFNCISIQVVLLLLISVFIDCLIDHVVGWC